MTEPEFSRTVRIDSLGSVPRHMSIVAGEAERAALARRFGFVALGKLDAEVALVRTGDSVKAEGRISAVVTQSCVATGVPIEEAIGTPFEVEFRPHPVASSPDEELELEDGELDVIFHDGAIVDVGEAVAETLPLSVEPYPRAPDADRALSEAGIKREEEAGPFAALASLRDKLAP